MERARRQYGYRDLGEIVRQPRWRIVPHASESPCRVQVMIEDTEIVSGAGRDLEYAADLCVQQLLR